MTRKALEGTFEVLASPGNLNNAYGLPLSIFPLEARHQVAVLEMGISTKDEMARLVEIADPDVGVVTNVHGAHLANFADEDEYASAKADLYRGMRSNTTGVFNADDPRCVRMISEFRGFAVTYGMDAPADFTASNFRGAGIEGSSFDLLHRGRRHAATLRCPGAHSAMNALAAVASGFMLGADIEGMLERLSGFEPLSMRGRLHHLAGGVRLVDDSYNANPSSMRAALSVLAGTAPGAGGRRLAALGDMLELGSKSEASHRDAARALGSAGVATAWLVGPQWAAAAQTARQAGLPDARLFATAEEAARDLAREIRPGDVILVKASRGKGLDRIVETLLAGAAAAKSGAGGAN
jgi:UDP-N-acetylmuramoyl-tripeptide--D-alanyl-D-alanine ligase